ncbi:hypothetical protein [Bdellovibrio bacteriovorus]|uniref:hypothetical protein n=1 Tax=Bdellovibrio bacteriovorus TaxID=959 RepID=UPI001E4F12F4|nr:hypothetical protein [Bdellovibrio bacteriovorus]
MAYYFGLSGINTVDETSFGKPLAVVREKKKDVKHKYPGDFFWRTSDDGQKLFNGSEVFVGGQSSTVLFFSGGRRARLSENTLLRISEDNSDKNKLILSLNDGGFNIRSMQADQMGLVLRVGEGSLKIRPGYNYDLHVKKKEDALGLSMASGNLVMDGVTDKSSLSQGESVVVRDRNHANSAPGNSNSVELYIDQVIDPTIKLISPVEKQIVYKGEKSTVFLWECSPSDRQVLEYSTHPDFYENVKEFNVTGQKLYPIPMEHMQGDVFWRIVSYTEGIAKYSSPSYFKVANLQPAAFKEVNVHFVERGKWQLLATVQSTDPEARYEFQLSRFENFSEPYDAYVGAPPFRSLIDQDGKFFLRMRRLYSNQLVSEWTSTKVLQIRPPIVAPTLTLAPNTEYSQGVTTATFSWNMVADAEFYLLRLSSTSSFISSNVIRLPKNKQDYSISESLTQNMYAVIQAEAAEGEVSPISNIVTLQPPSNAAKGSLAKAGSNRSGDAGSASAAANLTLLSPANNSVAYVDKPVELKWSGPAVTLELSPVRQFSQNVEKLKVAGTTNLGITRKTPGSLYWRLVGTDGRPTEARRLSLVAVSDINLDRAQLRFIERGKWEILAKVRDAKNQEQFNLQLSRTEDFKKIEDSYKGTLANGFKISTPGEYFIRAQRLLADKPASKWSNAASVDIRAPLSTPVLTEKKEDLISPIAVRVTINWKPVPFAKDYLIEVADTPMFGNVQLKIKVNETKYAVEHATKEPSFVRVLARSQEGELSPASEVFKIKGVLPGPVIERYEITYANIEKSKDSDSLHILWTHRKNAKKYVVEVARTEDLKNSTRIETKNIEIFMPIKEVGWYYFRMIPISENPDFFDTPSKVYGVEYRKQADLIAAEMDAPAKGANFKAGEAIRFAWGQILSAAWYELEVSNQQDFKGSTVYKIEARDYYLRQGLTQGRWYFRIRGRSSSQVSPWSNTSFIDVQ